MGRHTSSPILGILGFDVFSIHTNKNLFSVGNQILWFGLPTKITKIDSSWTKVFFYRGDINVNNLDTSIILRHNENVNELTD